MKFEKCENIVKALLCRGREQRHLFACARQTRNKVFSNKVEVRSVIEYSNICRQACNYCGMNKLSGLKRYILSDDEFLKRIGRLYNAGRRVIMVQTGETNSDNYFENLYRLLKQVKSRHSCLIIIASFGNMPEYRYKKLKGVGIERYLLKFETSDPKLYKIIKPSDTLGNRLKHIRTLKKLGFEVSSGSITGLPGQSLKSLADDLILLKKLNIPMGSTSAFIPNELSNYANCLPANINLTLNFMAVLRIMRPDMIIPSTSSLELVIKNGQYLGLKAGANAVTLHDGTPVEDESKYVIYKKDRYKPRDILFKIARKAGLEVSNDLLG